MTTQPLRPSVEDAEESPPPDVSFRVLGGRKVVAGMLLFGVVMVSAMGLYWHLYTRPFRSLQEAIHAEYPDIIPRVIGGQHKSHQSGSASVLRIVLNIEFNPETADSQTLDDLVARLRILAEEKTDLSAYKELEIHFVQRVPESKPRSRSFRLSLVD